jgi:putative transposase
LLKISTFRHEQKPHDAGALLDCGFREFRRQLLYKAAMRGGRILVADLPSSKTCSACGCVNPDAVLGIDIWQRIQVANERDSDGAIILRSQAWLRTKDSSC